MAKEHFGNFLEYTAVQIIRLALLFIPKTPALWLGIILGKILEALLISRRRLVIKNLESSFPELSSAQRQLIAGKFWRHIGQTLMEFVKIPHINRDNVDRFIEVRGLRHIEDATKNGKGCLLVTIHMGNWEMIGTALALHGVNLAAIARSIKNPLVNNLINRTRENSGTKIISHRRAVRGGLKWLRENKVLGVLVDQNFYSGGVFVNFFNRPAASTPLAGLLSQRAGSPLVGAKSWRENGKTIVEIIPLGNFFSTPNDMFLQQHTQWLTSITEDWIREKPELWLWMHNRWKTQQPGTGT